jgi:hypothetical protein
MNNTPYIVSICNCCKKDFRYRRGQVQLCQNCRRKSKRLAYRISAANYKHNQCEICGLKRNSIDDLEMFDFHHIDRTDKSFELGDRIESRNWETIKNELDKCMMLCANCHRKQHIYNRNETVVKYAQKLIPKYS